ncbi:MAG TPA: DNA primase [Acholeplasmatales bacterium]|nr:DNA primase [Acholeplasmatales bacterium]
MILIISDEILNKIKAEADIVKIIGEYVKLEKKGGNFVGLCPFHPDTNPSLSVSPSKKIYKCFSCGASGNVFTFLQEYEHVPFPRAVQMAADKCGIKIEVDPNREESENYSKYYGILQKVTNFYEFFLKNTNDGKEALEYLAKRHLSEEVIKQFRIGLSPNQSDLLYRNLLNEKIQPLDMIESGVVKSGNKEYYDVFRNRIMFPIEDMNGNIVGFSGRIFRESKEKEAKYMNSGENVIFKKGNILYNYKNALNEIKMKNKVIIFEGFMDVIAAFRANVFHVLATMGTAVTPNQIKAINKATNNVILCYDGDAPGIEATKKAIHLFNNAKFNVSVVRMPEGLDPDEYINNFGAERLNHLLNNETITGIDYLYEIEKKNLIVADINSVEKFKVSIFSYMNYYDSHVLNERYLKRLSDDLGVSSDSLQRDFEKQRSSQLSRDYPSDNTEPIVEFGEKEKKPEIPKIKGKYALSEQTLIRKIFNDKTLCLETQSILDVKYVLPTGRDLLFRLYEYYHKNDSMDEEGFMASLDPKLIDLLKEILENGTFDFMEVGELIGKIEEYQSSEMAKNFRSLAKDGLTADQLSAFGKHKKKCTVFVPTDKERK